MSTSRVDLILRHLDALPPLPAVAVRVLELTSQPTVDARELVPLIESDPALASRILALVHRADAPTRGGTSIERAIVLLGFRPIRAAVLAMAVMQTFPAGEAQDSSGDEPTRADFWMHSLAVGCAAELLAERAKRRAGAKAGGSAIDPAEAFCCGLLHDLGKLALSASLPKSYGRVVHAADVLRGNIADVEREVIGIDHHTAGRRLAERWRLPAGVRDVVWLHNQHPAALPESVAAHAPMIALVTLGDHLARMRHLGYSGNYGFGIPLDLLTGPLGLDQEDLDAVLEALVERTSARSEVLGIGSADASELYRQALERASQELSQTQDRLEEQARRQRDRARCFAALSGLRDELHPSATVADVLSAVAQTACEALGSGPVAAFAFAADGSTEMILHNGDRTLQGGQVDARAELPTLLAPAPDSEETLVLPAGDELEWLTSRYGPSLHGHRCWWMSLRNDSGTIGGVVWGGDEHEQQRLAPDAEALSALCAGWSLALGAAKARDDTARLAEQLAEANHRLAEAQDQMTRDRAALSIAELAAGAAHEMNNPLMVISGRSQLLYQSLPDERDRQSALAIYNNSQRLSDMITSLMRFARPEAAEPEPTPVAELLAETMRLVEELPERQHRAVDWNLADVPPVLVDGRQVMVALAALLENAFQATPAHSGRVEIRAATELAGRQAVISVIDNGPGMDAETLAHAFDPFFSRKKAGRRRGMGLSVAQRLIQANGGTLRLDSREGSGTRAVVTLPLSVQAAAPAPARKTA